MYTQTVPSLYVYVLCMYVYADDCRLLAFWRVRSGAFDLDSVTSRPNARGVWRALHARQRPVPSNSYVKSIRDRAGSMASVCSDLGIAAPEPSHVVTENSSGCGKVTKLK